MRITPTALTKVAALAAMLSFLVVNRWTIDTTNDEMAETILALAAGHLSKEGLTEWVTARTRPLESKQ